MNKGMYIQMSKCYYKLFPLFWYNQPLNHFYNKRVKLTDKNILVVIMFGIVSVDISIQNRPEYNIKQNEGSIIQRLC